LTTGGPISAGGDNHNYLHSVLIFNKFDMPTCTNHTDYEKDTYHKVLISYLGDSDHYSVEM